LDVRLIASTTILDVISAIIGDPVSK